MLWKEFLRNLGAGLIIVALVSGGLVRLPRHSSPSKSMALFICARWRLGYAGTTKKNIPQASGSIGNRYRLTHINVKTKRKGGV